MKIIEVTISPAGETSIETRGFQGDECKRISRPLELALGVRTDETLTSEYHSELRDDPHAEPSRRDPSAASTAKSSKSR